MTALKGKRIVVTGGTSGIGYAAAEAMISEGAEVIITGQDAQRVEDASQALGDAATGLVAPSQQPDSADRIAAAAKERFGGVDVVFANAGVTWPGPLGDITAEAVAHQFAVNFTGPLLTIQALAPLMGEGGSIIVTTSSLDRAGMPGMAVYSATKAALRSLVRTCAAELAERGIRINSIAPGPIETPIYAKLGMPEEQLQGMSEFILTKVPQGRFGKPEEIAGAAVFLASDASTYMLGEEITIDGGWTNI